MRYAIVMILILSSLVLALGRATAARYAHDLPVAYRSVTYAANQTATVQACARFLRADGFNVACADTIAGLVYTEPRVLPPRSKEIGGVARIRWMAQVSRLEQGSLVTAEFLKEEPVVGGWWVLPMDEKDAMAVYRRFFKAIQAQLDSVATSDVGVAPKAG